MIYRIMVVEDEPPSMRSIEKHILNCGVSDLAIVGKAANGADALKLIPKVQPHIIFSDVHMPVMDGFALVEQVRKEYPDILIVILSGYQEFEYVKKALQFRLSDYLLKPINPQELAVVLEKLKAAVLRTIYQSTAKYLRACIGRYPPEDLPSRALKHYLVLTVNAGLYCDRSDCSKPPALLDKTQLHLLLDDIANEQYTWIVELGSANRMVAVIGVTSAQRINTAPLLHRFSSLPQNTPLTISYAAADLHEAIPDALIRTEQRIRFALIPGKAQLLDADAPFSPQIPPAIPQAEWKKLLSILDSYGPSRFANALSSLLTQLIPPGSPQQCYRHVFDSVIALLKAQFSGLDSRSMCILESLPEKIFSYCLPDSIIQEFTISIQNFISSCDQVSASDSTTDAIIEKIASYLRRNYSGSVELSSLAVKFGISPAYLSTIFKKVYGVTPIKYLLNIRVEKAKELIASDPDITFRQVAQMVGYEDAHYFSRIFRSMAHLTPSEYRASLETLSENK